MLMLMYDPKQKHQKLHTSERTIVPRTVIFSFTPNPFQNLQHCQHANIIYDCNGSETPTQWTKQPTYRPGYASKKHMKVWEGSGLGLVCDKEKRQLALILLPSQVTDTTSQG